VVSHTLVVHVGQAALLAIGVGKPTEKVIEAAILHGDYDYVLDAGISWVR